MTSLNKVFLIGVLCSDPQKIHSSNSQCTSVRITVSTNRRFRDSKAIVKEETEWHQVVLNNHFPQLQKGSSVFVEGRLQTRKWKGEDQIVRFTTEIICDSVQVLG